MGQSSGPIANLPGSMDGDRVADELVAGMAAWLADSHDLWDAIAREGARRTLRQLLANPDGDDDFIRDRLRFTGSPAMRALVPSRSGESRVGQEWQSSAH